MIKPDQLVLSAYCKQELDLLAECQLRKHADLLLERLAEVLVYMPKVELADPWKKSFASRLDDMLNSLEWEK